MKKILKEFISRINENFKTLNEEADENEYIKGYIDGVSYICNIILKIIK